MDCGNDGTLKLLACQLVIPVMTSAVERDQHLKKSAEKVRDALSEEAVDLVVLPELSSIDYSRATFSKLDELAEPLEGPSTEVWRGIAREFQTTVVYSFPRRSKQGVHISLAAVNPQGEVLGHYDKLHRAQYGASMEKEYFVGGDHLMVFEVNGLRLAPIICYDIRIPELSRTLVLEHEVDAILHCGAYYRDESFYSWHAFVVTRAMENQVYLLSLNRAGEHYGHSVFCGPWVDEDQPSLAFSERGEEFRYFVLEKEVIRRTREDYSFLRDQLGSYDLPLLSVISGN